MEETKLVSELKKQVVLLEKSRKVSTYPDEDHREVLARNFGFFFNLRSFTKSRAEEDNRTRRKQAVSLMEERPDARSEPCSSGFYLIDIPQQDSTNGQPGVRLRFSGLSTPVRETYLEGVLDDIQQDMGRCHAQVRELISSEVTPAPSPLFISPSPTPNFTKPPTRRKIEPAAVKKLSFGSSTESDKYEDNSGVYVIDLSVLPTHFTTAEAKSCDEEGKVCASNTGPTTSEEETSTTEIHQTNEVSADSTLAARVISSLEEMATTGKKDALAQLATAEASQDLEVLVVTSACSQRQQQSGADQTSGPQAAMSGLLLGFLRPLIGAMMRRVSLFVSFIKSLGLRLTSN